MVLKKGQTWRSADQDREFRNILTSMPKLIFGKDIKAIQ